MSSYREKLETLYDAEKKGKLSHAYLFCSGTYGAQINAAKELAKAILCRDEKSRNLVVNGTHPDLHILSPEDGSSTLSVNTIREELVEKTYKRPYYSGRSVFIVQNAHLMSVGASNALLKVLEEPPEYVVIILTSKSSQLMLDTILSRVIKVDFRVCDIKELPVFEDVEENERMIIFERALCLPQIYSELLDGERDQELLLYAVSENIDEDEQMKFFKKQMRKKDIKVSGVLFLRTWLTKWYFDKVLSKHISFDKKISLLYFYIDLMKAQNTSIPYKKDAYGMILKYFSCRLRKEDDWFIIEKIYSALGLFSEFEQYDTTNIEGLVLLLIQRLA